MVEVTVFYLSDKKFTCFFAEAEIEGNVSVLVDGPTAMVRKENAICIARAILKHYGATE